MNRLIFFMTLLSSLNAFALGPIPNGTYTGTENCTGYPPITDRFVITDNTLEWDDLKLAFDVDPNGFFKMHSLDGSASGLGHFTKDGLHFEAIFEMPTENGKTVSVPGEDLVHFQPRKTPAEFFGLHGIGRHDVLQRNFPEIRLSAAVRSQSHNHETVDQCENAESRQDDASFDFRLIAAVGTVGTADRQSSENTQNYNKLGLESRLCRFLHSRCRRDNSPSTRCLSRRPRRVDVRLRR